MKFLVTGSSGFLGSRFIGKVASSGILVRSVSRNVEDVQTKLDEFSVATINGNTNWNGAFDGVDCVVHCAARVHQMREPVANAIQAYLDINTDGTLNLARQAALAGVKRFVFISSVKVNGEFSQQNEKFTPCLSHRPNDPYGLSKYEAEIGLKVLAEELGIEVVIIRPPLVYGPGVKANFLSMIKLLDKGVPLPLGAIDNQRSFVYIDNLVDLMLTCCIHPKAGGETFLVSDDEDVSTTKLLNSVARALKSKARLLSVPKSIICFLAKLTGKPQFSQRICDNLQVDITKTKSLLNWSPPFAFEEGIRKTVEAYVQLKNN
ncbi:SDR family oxidoreductase [Vibrio makurazakiensis]|uniref:UDP-glucose 4-epimerase family protein n=1 Tax=Vibrio makurazakiensis TaxID=2910250 RepID=UPI003D10653D